MIRIFIDGDACPVKDEVFKVAGRYGLPVTVVGNSWLRLPNDPLLTMVVVAEGADAADDRIVEMIEAADICVTNDIPLGGRCLAKGALAIRPNGKPFTEASIGDALATRELMNALRETGAITGGPAPFAKQDRSRFLSALDTMVHQAKRLAR
ncbi:YaiI/YqxD family protein [Paramagnetospirillum kuznetsovii]|uniref:UPF0178 protein CU669_14855 n=1 Tax=Paramagnetospirillum kuznetsovii TaxID=2053833 RepID=A0A364NVN8_9PROT|nr:YaiI/YqxD family protein [Paramagnetospirillum kuznetsovii]RAU21122.1 YaiI/YqxD family protein [Paramagnetospirillum kuznetsovii]